MKVQLGYFVRDIDTSNSSLLPTMTTRPMLKIECSAQNKSMLHKINASDPEQSMTPRTEHDTQNRA